MLLCKLYMFCLLYVLMLTGCSARVIEVPSRETQILIDRGAAFLELKKPALAIASFQMSLEQQPTPQGYDGLACAYTQLHRFKDAIDIFSKIRKWFPRYTPAIAHEAYLHDIAGRYSSASQRYSEAISVEPLDFTARNNMAVMEADRSGNFSNGVTKRYIEEARTIVAHPVVDKNLRLLTDTDLTRGKINEIKS